MSKEKYTGAVILRFHVRNKRGFESFRLKPKSLGTTKSNQDTPPCQFKKEILIDRAPRSSLNSLIANIINQGFAFKDFFRREDSSRYNIRHTAEFCLVHPEYFNIWKQECNHSVLSMELALKTLIWMVEESLWDARVEMGPWKECDAELMHINLNSRAPLVLPNGEPVKEWVRDENGQKVGEFPVPVSPKNDLGELVSRMFS